MPTATFFRLPEEKRKRLLEASWAELSQVRVIDMSINHIIAVAHIPRGSFYQYFTDKDDLIRYLLEDIREYFIGQLRDILTDAEGDLFAFPLMAYDRFMGHQGGTDPILERFICFLHLNHGIDLHAFIGGPQHFLPDQLWELIDASKLRRNEREYADHVFHMACAALALAVMETHCGQAFPGAPWEACPGTPREALQIRMDMLRYGGTADGYKEATT